MPVDNITLNAGSGGATMRTLADAGGSEWPTATVCYATTVSPGANVLQVVTASAGLPVAQQGTWNVGVTGSVAVTGTFWQATQPVSIASAVPVTGTFWQTTQPISGAVTANAGTNLNTSALALETGGHLASIDGKVPSLGQALAAASVPVVLTAAQLATLTPISTVSISGTVPVSGTFWQATQPVSGTVTANAGTNLNTSALALESGGHLASLDTKLPAQGQALAAASIPVVLPAAQITTLTPPSTVAATQSGTWTNTVTQATAANLNATVVGTGTFTTQAQQSGTWNIGTVTTFSAVTGITNALPAGTNLIGQVAQAPQVAAAYNGTTSVTPQYAAISASSSGTTTIVAAVSGKKIYVLRWNVSANGNVNVNLQSHTTTGTATGVHYLTQYASCGGSYCPVGIFATATGEALDINLSASVSVGGEITYCQF